MHEKQIQAIFRFRYALGLADLPGSLITTVDDFMLNRIPEWRKSGADIEALFEGVATDTTMYIITALQDPDLLQQCLGARSRAIWFIALQNHCTRPEHVIGCAARKLCEASSHKDATDGGLHGVVTVLAVIEQPFRSAALRYASENATDPVLAALYGTYEQDEDGFDRKLRDLMHVAAVPAPQRNPFGPQDITCDNCRKVYVGIPAPLNRLPPRHNFCTDKCRQEFKVANEDVNER